MLAWLCDLGDITAGVHDNGYPLPSQQSGSKDTEKHGSDLRTNLRVGEVALRLRKLCCSCRGPRFKFQQPYGSS